MITTNQQNRILETIVGSLELPLSAYETAKSRYEDLGTYLAREGSSCELNDPLVYSQGSFRLGTAIRPLDSDEDYDLDLASCLRSGVSTKTHTQEDLKTAIGRELQSYRTARGIKAPVEEKHRCWRLEYEDGLSFHMDIVPCIPASDASQELLTERMIYSGQTEELSTDVSKRAVDITDDRSPEYASISDAWQISNPEGFARWFESRIQGGETQLLEKGQVEDLPLFARKSPLQRSIQVLKRHRDQMFKEAPDSKPISVIITTLAARVYSGQPSLAPALQAISEELERFSLSGSSIVLNPVNPDENFADRWTMPESSHLYLRENFHAWVAQLRADMETLMSTQDTDFIAESAAKKMGIRASPENFRLALGASSSAAIRTVKSHEIEEGAAKPWGQ